MNNMNLKLILISITIGVALGLLIYQYAKLVPLTLSKLKNNDIKKWHLIVNLTPFLPYVIVLTVMAIYVIVMMLEKIRMFLVN